MNYPNERPNITETFDIDRGYGARALCLVYGYPAEVELDVNTKNRDYSTFGIMVFHPLEAEWRTVYELNPGQVGHIMPIGNDPAALVWLNGIAARLWETANLVMSTAVRRQDVVEAEAQVTKRDALARNPVRRPLDKVIDNPARLTERPERPTATEASA